MTAGRLFMASLLYGSVHSPLRPTSEQDDLQITDRWRITSALLMGASIVMSFNRKSRGLTHKSTFFGTTLPVHLDVVALQATVKLKPGELQERRGALLATRRALEHLDDEALSVCGDRQPGARVFRRCRGEGGYRLVDRRPRPDAEVLAFRFMPASSSFSGRLGEERTQQLLQLFGPAAGALVVPAFPLADGQGQCYFLLALLAVKLVVRHERSSLLPPGRS